MKLVLSGLVMTIALALSTVTFAQNNPPAGTAGTAGAATDQGDAKADKKTDKKGKHNKAGKHSNKGGEVRGLDRADEVSGKHGEQGRATAREHMSSNGRPSFGGGGHGRR